MKKQKITTTMAQTDFSSGKILLASLCSTRLALLLFFVSEK